MGDRGLIGKIAKGFVIISVFVNAQGVGIEHFMQINPHLRVRFLILGIQYLFNPVILGKGRICVQRTGILQIGHQIKKGTAMRAARISQNLGLFQN